MTDKKNVETIVLGLGQKLELEHHHDHYFNLIYGGLLTVGYCNPEDRVARMIIEVLTPRGAPSHYTLNVHTGKVFSAELQYFEMGRHILAPTNEHVYLTKISKQEFQKDVSKKPL